MFPTVETDFGLNLLCQAPINESLVVSPISVIFALAMVQAGAKGRTKSQINSVISKDESDEEIQSYYSNLSAQIQNPTNGVKSRIANGFFLNKDYTIENNYESIITEKYAAKVQSLNFDKAVEAAKTIDDFIRHATEEKIHDMVTEKTVKDAFSILVNAIYFTAKWENPFDKELSTNETFYGINGINRKVEYMSGRAEHKLYVEDDDVQLLSLPYRDASYAFNIFLPKTRLGLHLLRSELTGKRMLTLLSKLGPTFIAIKIPKMKIKTDFKLGKALLAMGVSEMFSDRADLSGITKSPPLKVSEAAHKAIIEVDEDGTTAAAASVVKISVRSGIRPPLKTFAADHSFLFVLTKDKNPLFVGQFV